MRLTELSKNVYELKQDGNEPGVREKLRKLAAERIKNPDSNIVAGDNPIYDRNFKVIALSANAITDDEQAVIDSQEIPYSEDNPFSGMTVASMKKVHKEVSALWRTELTPDNKKKLEKLGVNQKVLAARNSKRK